MYKIGQKQVDEVAKDIHQMNVDAGWWPEEGRCIDTCFQLISTELAEATEGERKNLMDDKLPTRKMGEVELADAMIRLLDLAGFFKWRYFGGVKATKYFKEDSTISAKHWACNKTLVDLHNSTARSDISLGLEATYADVDYSRLVNILQNTALSVGYNLWDAVEEKMEFNKHRADHKIENREKKHGKKF